MIKDNISHLRSNKNVVQPNFSTVQYGKCSFNYTGSHIWNVLPRNLQQAVDINGFRKLIKIWTGPSCQCNMCNIVLPF